MPGRLVGEAEVQRSAASPAAARGGEHRLVGQVDHRRRRRRRERAAARPRGPVHATSTGRSGLGVVEHAGAAPSPRRRRTPPPASPRSASSAVERVAHGRRVVLAVDQDDDRAVGHARLAVARAVSPGAPCPSRTRTCAGRTRDRLAVVERVLAEHRDALAATPRSRCNRAWSCPRRRVVETVPAFTTNRSSSRHAYGTCLWPESTRCTSARSRHSSASPASCTTLRSRPVPGTGSRWWCSTKIRRYASLRLKRSSIHP